MPAPPITPPPRKDKGKGPPSEDKVFSDQLKKHPEWSKYRDSIVANAATFGVSKVYLLGLMIIEGGSKNPGANSKGASGLAQIADKSIAKATNAASWDTMVRIAQNLGYKITNGGQITDKMKADPAFAMAYAAWRLKGTIVKTGSFEAAYHGVKGVSYNPNFTGDSRGKTAMGIAGIPPTFVPPKGTAVTPADVAAVAANQSGQTAAAKTALQARSDPWMTWDKKTGKIGFSTASNPPKNALIWNTSQGPVALSRSQFLGLKTGSGSENGIADIWHAWTNQDPTDKQVANVIAHGWSTTTLGKVLSQHASFVGSPVWRASAPALTEQAKQMYGSGFQVDPKLIRQAIVEGWDKNPAVWQAKLRSLPQYTKSNEFKTAYIGFEQVFEQTYGVPTDSDKALVKNAVLARWSPDQFASYLRSRPEYVNSPGYMKAQEAATRSFASWAGVDPVLTQKINQSPLGSAANPYANTSPDTKVPKDKRIKGNPQAPMGHPSTFIAGNPATPQLNPAWEGIP